VGFVFRLAVPLRLARVRRDEQRRELAIVYRDLRLAEAELREGFEQVERIGGEILARAGAGIAGSELAALSLGRDRARLRLPALRKQVDLLRVREEETRTALGSATREVTVLEKVRRRAFEEHRRDLRRREQAMIDDVLLVRRARAMADARAEQDAGPGPERNAAQNGMRNAG
jgi:flagellar export protein FliJ